MAINKQPVARKCRALGVSPAEMGYGKKQSKRNPGGTRRKKVSEYGAQLKEKQKVKFVYGVLEKQFHKYYLKATNMKGITGDNMLQLLELRLDNVVYRLGLGKTRRAARQIVVHGHIRVNGQKVDIPSYSVKVGDVIQMKEKSANSPHFKEFLANQDLAHIPSWMELDAANHSVKIVAVPKREEIDIPVNEQMIVELYNK